MSAIQPIVKLQVKLRFHRLNYRMMEILQSSSELEVWKSENVIEKQSCAFLVFEYPVIVKVFVCTSAKKITMADFLNQIQNSNETFLET